MSGNAKKIRKMYEEYLRENLEGMTKLEVIEQFVQTVLGVTDMGNPEVYHRIVDVLLKYERKKTLQASGEKLEGSESNFGEELDFSSMYKPKDFNDLRHQLKLLSQSADLDMGDIFTADRMAASLKEYMFDVEVPWVGTIDGVLCFSWSGDKKRVTVLSFIQGAAQLETTVSEAVSVIELSDDNEVDDSDVMAILYLAHEAER